MSGSPFLLDHAKCQLMCSYTNEADHRCHEIKITWRQSDARSLMQQPVFIQLKLEEKPKKDHGMTVNYFNITPEDNIGYSIWDKINDNFNEQTHEFIFQTYRKIRFALKKMNLPPTDGYLIYCHPAAKLSE